MFKDVSFGQYYPTNSLVHRLDARVKLFLTLLFIVVIFFVKSYFGFMLTAFVLLVVVLTARLPMASVLKSVRGILFIIVFTSLLNLFFIKQGDVLVSWNIGRTMFAITKTGVHTTIKMVLRLVLLIIGASILSLTTTPVQLADGVESLMSPLKLIKIPVRDIAMIMSIALRFIPTLFEETNKIIAAQKARGASFDTGNLFARAKAMMPVLIPLFVNSFRRADELAFAMDARCYNATDKRTKMKKAKFGFGDAIALLFILSFATVIMLDRYYFGTIGIDIDYMIFGGLL
ncbi:MAG: energy-coupling factor transporter transmembrane protein EcfT [Clostridia bacterium]|nr:energy-coupling factor transporter transmembrane protein EcfT [Clostridia bacterium]